MGAGASTEGVTFDLNELSAEDVADCVSCLGPEFAVYRSAIIAHDILGQVLLNSRNDQINEILAMLEVNDHGQRVQLLALINDLKAKSAALLAASKMSELSQDTKINEECILSCENIVALLKKEMLYEENDSEVIKCLSRIIVLATSNDDANLAKLSSCGVCEAVVSTLKIHMSNAPVVLQCCTAMYHLSNNYSDNVSRFGECGGCQGVVTTLTTYMETVDVVQEAMKAMKILLSRTYENENHYKFVSCEGCEAIISVMKSLMSNVLIAEEFCRIICSLLLSPNSEDYGIPSKFSSKIVCECVIQLLNTLTSNADVAERGCAVIRHVSSIVPGAQGTFGKLGGCEAIVLALKTHTYVDEVVAQACGAILALTESDDNNNKEKFETADVVAALESQLRSHRRGESDVHDYAKQARSRFPTKKKAPA